MKKTTNLPRWQIVSNQDKIYTLLNKKTGEVRVLDYCNLDPLPSIPRPVVTKRFSGDHKMDAERILRELDVSDKPARYGARVLAAVLSDSGRNVSQVVHDAIMQTAEEYHAKTLTVCKRLWHCAILVKGAQNRQLLVDIFGDAVVWYDGKRGGKHVCLTNFFGLLADYIRNHT